MYMYLEVSVDDGFSAVVQSRHCLTDICEYPHHLVLCEPSLQSSIHHVYYTTTCTRTCTVHGQKLVLSSFLGFLVISSCTLYMYMYMHLLDAA